MIEIIPAILTESDEEFVRQVHILERVGVKRVHLDIADGLFVPQRTIRGYEQLLRLNTDMLFDVHLMVQRPEKYCSAWFQIPNATRFLIHVESTKVFLTIRDMALEKSKLVGAVLNPETDMSSLDLIRDFVDVVQFMTVHPGAQGRSFAHRALDTMTEFHSAHPTIPLMVDGGVTPDTAPLCVRAGATKLVSGSFVMRSSDTARAIRDLSASVMI